MQTLIEHLQYYCDDSEGETTLVLDYSGRGMYGNTCVGVSGAKSSCMKLIGYVIKNIGMEISATALVSGLHRDDKSADDLASVEELFDQSVDTLLNFSQDSMGLDVILYWPDLVNNA